MILDYQPGKETFVLHVPRGEADIKLLMLEHGLDFYTGSDADDALLVTRDPYAAAAFVDVATDDAMLKLASICFEINESWRDHSDANIACPADKELWPFQKANIEYALRRQNTLVGDEPGLGKTPTAICFANEIKAKKALVVCPANIRLQWHTRIQEWTTMPYPYNTIYPILKGTHGTNPDAAWTVVSYDLARTPAIGKALAKEHYDVLILDEPHYLKESDTKRTQAIFGGGRDRAFPPLAGCAERILGLTGTPLPNRPREAYTLSRGLCFDSIDFCSEATFQSRFNPSLKKQIVDQFGNTKVVIDERSGRHGELQNRLRTWFMTRHLKHGPRGVMKQLKLPIYDLIQIEETRAIKQALEAESLLKIDVDDLEGADMTVLGHIAVVRHQMGLAMAPQIADHIEMLLDDGEEKLVVFAWHIDVLDLLEERFKRHGCVRIDGRTSAKEKQAKVNRFIKEPELRIALGNTLSMGTGTDGLQEVCNHGLICEPDWVAGNNIQAFDRLDRGGQRCQVQGDIFVAPGSIAEKILAKAVRKSRVTHKALDYRMGDALYV